MKADTICCYWVSKCMTKETLQNHCMCKQQGIDQLRVRWAYFQE